LKAFVSTYRLYGEKPAESADFWLHCETLPERSRLHDWTIAAHRHEAFFQIFLVARGQGEMLVGERWEAFSGPAVLFIPPGAVHGFRFTPDVDGTVVTALADRLRSLAAADRQVAIFAETQRVVVLDADDFNGVPQAIGRIAQEASRLAEASNVRLEALITQAIVGLARITSPKTGSVPGREQVRLAQLQTLIATHFREHRPTAFFAGRIGVSATHLNRMTRLTSGLSVQDMLANRLLDQAQRDLIFTPTSIQAIADSLGFSDPAYFIRFFRKDMRTTPGQFRAAERKRPLAA
jgi:AraC family transcriptional activator of pobA